MQEKLEIQSAINNESSIVEGNNKVEVATQTDQGGPAPSMHDLASEQKMNGSILRSDLLSDI